MGIFSTSSPFDTDVEKATPEDDKDTEDWATILEICDKIGESTQHAKDSLKSIIRRLNHPNPHVVLKAITLLDACVNNCKRSFHLEIASREFEQEFKKLLKKFQSQPKIFERLKLLLRKWAENEFKSDPQLSLIPALYARLKMEGLDFNISDNSSKNNNSSSLTKDPNAVTSQQEVDDIAKAIELSLKESSLSSSKNSLYPSNNALTNLGTKTYQSTATKGKKFVKALYDFEAAEDNELTFYTGEIIEVLDDSDKNWWKGVNHRGEGLFPTNFVTSDLSSSSSSSLTTEKENKTDTASKRKNRVRFNDAANVSLTNDSRPENVVINEQKIDRLLHLLHEANPHDESADTEEMIRIEEEVNAMGPLIDTELEKVDRKHAQLTQLSSNLVDALNLYHTLMREPFVGSQQSYMGSMPMHHTLPHPHSVVYNSGVNGPYSLPPSNVVNERFNSNTLPPPAQQHSAVMHPQMNQPTSHHFIPISTVPPVQSDSYLMPNMVQSPPSTHSFTQSMDPNLVPVQYNMPPPNMISPIQMAQNVYQPMQHPIPSQESMSPGVNGLPNNSRM